MGNSLPGRDVLNTSPIAVEVKARTRFEPLKAIQQAERNAGEDNAVVFLRMPGQGENVGQWLALTRVEYFRELIGRAYNLGEYSRESPTRELGQGTGDRIRVRLEPRPNDVGNAILQGILPPILHVLGFEPGDYEMEIRRSESQSGET